MFLNKSIKSIFPILFLSLFANSLLAQTVAPIDTSYFVPWDEGYNLLLAVDKADTSSIKTLLKRGANVNTTTFEGVTPLMYACESGNLAIVTMLVEGGADINKKPLNGTTALIGASKKNNYEIAEYLVNKKVELNARDENGVTAVNYAAAFNNFDIMDMLIFYGAKMNLSDNKGNAPLISAAFNNSLEAADLLVQNGAAIDTTDIDGFTALMTAVQKGNNEIAYLLIDKGADIHAVNKGGYSALTFAVAASNYELAEYLINMGADINQKTESGYSILEIAKYLKNDEIIDLLQSNDAENYLNPHFQTLTAGLYVDFNSTDFMNGLQFGLLDTKYGLGFNSSFGFRPAANRILFVESDTLTYQFWEKRYYFSLGIEKKIDLISVNNVSTGPYLGINELFTFGSYRGSDNNPPNKFKTVPSLGWYYSGSYFRTWIGFHYIDYKTPEIKPVRLTLGIAGNINLIKKRHINKRIDWLE